MASRFVLAVVATVAAASVETDHSAAAVACGDVDRSGRRARAVLTLDDRRAVTTLRFKQSTKPKTLSLVFSVTGCELSISEPPPTILPPLPMKDVSELPEEALSKPSFDSDAEGSTLFVLTRVEPKKFDAGTYGGHIIVRAPYLANNSTPISVSRSEDSLLKPVGIGLVGALFGLAWFLILKFVARQKLQVSWWWLIPLGVAALVLGGLAAWDSYDAQEVWTVRENWRATAVAGFTGASTGAVAALLVTIFRSPVAPGGN